MDWQDGALAAAGVIGSGVAAVHGVLVQRLLVRPIAALSGELKLPSPVLRLVPVLLHFSTLCWFAGGLALIAASLWGAGEARLTICLFVGGFYLFGAIGNFWATRGRHPGWMLMALALALIAAGAAG
jgi:hypothetical protein